MRNFRSRTSVNYHGYHVYLSAWPPSRPFDNLLDFYRFTSCTYLHFLMLSESPSIRMMCFFVCILAANTENFNIRSPSKCSRAKATRYCTIIAQKQSQWKKTTNKRKRKKEKNRYYGYECVRNRRNKIYFWMNESNGKQPQTIQIQTIRILPNKPMSGTQTNEKNSLMKIRFFLLLAAAALLLLLRLMLLFCCTVAGTYRASLPFYVAKMVQIHFIRKVKNVYGIWLPNVYKNIYL